MKPRRLGRLRTMGLVGSLVALLGGVAGCSFLDWCFHTSANSTRFERHLVGMGKTADGLMKDSDGEFVKDGIVYTHITQYQDTAREYGINISWDSLYLRKQSIGDGIGIAHRDTLSGNWAFTEQIIAPDQSIGTPWDTGDKEDRVQAENREIKAIAENVTKLARGAGYEGPIQVAQINGYPFGATPYSFFRGTVKFTDVNDGEVVKGNTGLPIKLSVLADHFNLGVDAKYVIENFAKLTTES